MDNEMSFMVYEGIVVPESALLKRECSNKNGSVPGLDDSELADPEELERQVLKQEFGPVLALPVKARKSYIAPNIDEGGTVDWGAFGTIDFDRYRPQFDKIRYKADMVSEQLKDVLIIFNIVNNRIRHRAKYLVLKYLRMGIIELEHIVNSDMLALARLYLRVRRMQKEITELKKVSEWRRQRKAEAIWGFS